MVKDLDALIKRAQEIANDKNIDTAVRKVICELFDFRPKWTPNKDNWVDLGLPSGNLWYNTNGIIDGKQYFDHDEAVESFGEYLPSATAMAELYENCEWEWIGGGYKVTGPNGNSIKLLAFGMSGSQSKECGYYWTRCVNKTSQPAHVT